MGFDMYWINEPPAVAELGAAVKALESRSQPYLLPGWEEANRAYWEATREHGVHWGSSYGWFHRAIESEMSRLGMVYSTPEMERAYNAFRHPSDHEWGEDDQCCDHARLFKRWREERGPQPGIPFYKFCGSDGWIVLPEEIHEALTIFEANRAERGSYTYPGNPEDAQWFDRWLRYMYCARGYGGFRVR